MPGCSTSLVVLHHAADHPCMSGCFCQMNGYIFLTRGQVLHTGDLSCKYIEITSSKVPRGYYAQFWSNTESPYCTFSQPSLLLRFLMWKIFKHNICRFTKMMMDFNCSRFRQGAIFCYCFWKSRKKCEWSWQELNDPMITGSSTELQAIHVSKSMLDQVQMTIYHHIINNIGLNAIRQDQKSRCF